ncbi:MAG: BMP family lipoprotein [Candidatus Thorarchaeota archaeon]|jgi:basic membrane lipoprotein Med (substrate-binding protein (PBP1-ABC) superfamily)
MDQKFIAAFIIGVIITAGAVGVFLFFTAGPPPEEPTYKAAIVMGGDETDLGFSYMAIQGAYRLRDKYGWEIDISRQVQFADQSRVVSDYAASGYDVIFCVGGQFIPTTYFEVATQYNDTFFVQIPGLNEYVPAPDNLVGLHPSFQTVGHYLAGEWYEYLSMEFYAFKAGVESVNTGADVLCRVAGTWGDAAIGYQITESLIQTKDADIIVQIADTTGRGVISACQDNNVTVIGTVGDQATLAPNVTMTSIGMDTPYLMEMVAQHMINGTFLSDLGGTSWELPIGNYLYPFHQFEDIIPQSVKDLLAQVEQDIADGTIVVPRTVTEDPPADP